MEEEGLTFPIVTTDVHNISILQVFIWLIHRNPSLQFLQYRNQLKRVVTSFDSMTNGRKYSN